MRIYYVDYEYAMDADRQPLGYFISRELAEQYIASTNDKTKYKYGFHGSDFKIQEIYVETGECEHSLESIHEEQNKRLYKYKCTKCGIKKETK